VFLDTPEKGVCLNVTSLFYASCQCNKCGFEISWLWRENTVFYFPIISMYCCYELSYVFYIYIYSSFIIPLEGCFSWHISWKKVLCLFTHDVTIIWNWHRGAYIFVVVNEIDISFWNYWLGHETTIFYFIKTKLFCYYASEASSLLLKMCT
jgi:hypothetical protein